MEGTYIQLNGGTISISAQDDGINAGQKSASHRATIEINGGTITVVMASGDTDGIDSNGDIVVNGGTVNVTGGSSFDCDGTATFNGGTIIVNGQTLSCIPNQQMGGKGRDSVSKPHSCRFVLVWGRSAPYRVFRYSLALMPVSFLNTRAKWAVSA